jgi:hypothetical protein
VAAGQQSCSAEGSSSVAAAAVHVPPCSALEGLSCRPALRFQCLWRRVAVLQMVGEAVVGVAAPLVLSRATTDHVQRPYQLTEIHFHPICCTLNQEASRVCCPSRQLEQGTEAIPVPPSRHRDQLRRQERSLGEPRCLPSASFASIWTLSEALAAPPHETALAEGPSAAAMALLCRECGSAEWRGGQWTPQD